MTPTALTTLSAEATERRQKMLDRVEKDLREALPGVTCGYIGNTYADGTDDRSWFIFLPHPGRVGTAKDRIGGVSTANRFSLVQLMLAMIKGAELTKEIAARG
jgi:hypothetical protein